MAILPRGQQPIARPAAPRPFPGVAPAPKMGPYPIGAALRVARDHAKAFPLERYYQVSARVGGIEVSIQSDTFAGDFWAKYGGAHASAADLPTLVRWLSARDAQMLRDGVIDRALGDCDVWWVVPYPRLPDMATRMGG